MRWNERMKRSQKKLEVEIHYEPDPTVSERLSQIYDQILFDQPSQSETKEKVGLKNKQ